MDRDRKRSAGSSDTGNMLHWSSSFLRQPAQVLIVEAVPPWWSENCKVVCDALDNFLSLACSLDGPCRIPLLSLYAISRQQECLLPFVLVRGNLARLGSCVEELRSLPVEGCTRGATRGGELLQQAVLDSLQQFKQYIRHMSTAKQASNNITLEITVLTSQPGQSIVRHLEMGLKDSDLVSLKRLLVVQIYSTADWGQDSPSPEATHNETDGYQFGPPVSWTKKNHNIVIGGPLSDCVMLGTVVDLQQIENSVFAIETVLKTWLHEQGGDSEHLQLLLPGPQDGLDPVCVKCDMQECLISPALIPLTHNLGMKTETVRDFLPVTKGSTNQSQPPRRLKAIKTLRADGVCESVLYGLPLLVRPTSSWQLDWDEMEANHNLFNALCHTLKSHDWFLLLQVDPAQRSTAGGVRSHYILQPSPALSLLLKPVVSKELLLPCSLPVSTQDPEPDAMQTMQACLTQLEEEFVFNPLSLSSNLYQHLRSRGLLSQPRYPYRLQSAAHRDQPPPLEDSKGSSSRQQRQPQSRPLGSTSRVRATVAPFPSSSSSSTLGPPPAKASRPALKLLCSSNGGCGRAPAPSRWEEDVDDDISMVIQ